MDVDVLQQNILAVLGNDAVGGPGAVRIRASIAKSRLVRPEFHTTGMIGDLQTLDLHITASSQIHDAG